MTLMQMESKSVPKIQLGPEQWNHQGGKASVEKN